MNIWEKIKLFFKKASKMTNGDYKSSGTVKGMEALGETLIKSIFSGNRLIYRCSNCNLVLKTTWIECPRCGTHLNW